jgi:zinc protease
MKRCSWLRGGLLGVLGTLALLTLVPWGSRTILHADTPATGPKDNPALQAAAALYEGIRTETLPNGLRIYLKPIPASPVVSTMVAYKVGSADENLDHTGLSHYLEHLMFKGTDKILPGDIDRLTLRNGGANNAYTSEDYTIYHFDFAADRWESVLEIEADRMRNLCIDAKHEFEQEKGAVIAELERNEDEPWDLEQKAILPLLFGTGPYGHPVIGERAHVRNATSEVIKAHYDKWYYPNNAALVICGGFEPERALAKIKQLFGPLPAGRLPERKTVPVAQRQGPVRKELESKFEVPRLLVGFNTVRLGDPDCYILDVVQSVLSSGKTGRLYKKLVEEAELAGSVDSTNSAGRYPGWFAIQVQMVKGKDRAKAETLLQSELKRLREEPISAAELKRVQRSVVANAIFGRESVHELADSIAKGVTTNDLDYLKTYLPRIQAVTAEDVQRVARKYFDPDKQVAIWSVPKAEGQGAGATLPNATGDELRRSSQPSIFSSWGRHSCLPWLRQTGMSAPPRQKEVGSSSSFSLKEARRVELPNGLVLLLLENHRLPIVVAEATVRRVVLLEPEDKAGVAHLVGALLDEGTPQHTGPQIAELIENAGGSLGMSSSGGTVKVLTPDRSLGLGLLFECLAGANFPKEVFAREREQLLSVIDDAERQPDAKAQMVYRAAVYGKHPYGRPTRGLRKTVEALTREDCVAFHRQTFVPNNIMVAIVGDFDSNQVIAEVTRLTAEWKKAPVATVKTPPVDKPKEFTQKIVTMATAAQLHFFLGHPGIRRDNPDYFKLLVMDYVLGTGPGFTDRLSARLRDRQGLAYTVSANISSSAGEEPGLFTCYVGTAPENFEQVKKLFLEELVRIRDEKPKAEEVEDAKKYLLGNLPFQLITNDRIAGQLLYVERYGLGLGYLDEYRKAVAAVTAEDVLAVARRYLDPEHMILVAAGALDANGKPLGKLPPPRDKP